MGGTEPDTVEVDASICNNCFNPSLVGHHIYIFKKIVKIEVSIL